MATPINAQFCIKKIPKYIDDRSMNIFRYIAYCIFLKVLRTAPTPIAKPDKAGIKIKIGKRVETEAYCGPQSRFIKNDPRK